MYLMMWHVGSAIGKGEGKRVSPLNAKPREYNCELHFVVDLVHQTLRHSLYRRISP